MQDRVARQVDIAFCRAYYSDLGALADADLLARAGAVAGDPSRPLNPAEFLDQVAAQCLLPADFDWRAYVFLNPDCAMLRLLWQAVLHYVRRGLPEGRACAWPFDADFYRQLYPDAHADAETLGRQWRAHGGARFGSLAEAAGSAGFGSLAWQGRFDAASYVSQNGLFAQVANDVQAIVHFVTIGWGALLPISADLAFDAAFVREFAGQSPDLSDAELYRRWLELGLLAGVPPNEAALLRKLDIDVAELPEGFDWRSYLRLRPTVSAEYQSKWGALEHFHKIGAIEPGAMPMQDDAARTLLIAAARRFARLGDIAHALGCVDRCALYGGLTPAQLQSVGEIEHLGGRFARALHAFRQVRESHTQTLLTWLRGGEAALALGDAAEAADWALGGLSAYPRSEHLDGLLLRAQTALFDAAVQRHIAAMLPASGRETEIAAELHALYALILAGYCTCGDSPAPPPESASGTRPLRVVMLANTDLPQCTFYRVTQKIAQLTSATARIVVIERDNWRDFVTECATADIAIFYRVAASVPVLRCLACCEANAIPTVYEVDDLVFEPAQFPDALESYAGAITADQHFELCCGVALVRFVLQTCDFAIASTDALAGRMAPLVRRRRAVTHRNCLPADVLAVAATIRERRAPCDDIVIFYGSGTRAHAADFRDQVEPALLRLLRDRPTVCFLACGHVDTSRLAAAFPDRVEHVPLLADRAAYAALMTSADINIAVLADTKFNACKSEIKWLEAAILAIPTIASDVAGMREIADEPDDLLVCGPDRWYEALLSLVDDPVRRCAIGAHAGATALARYQPLDHGRRLEQHLRSFLPGGREMVARARLLIVNVFFPPQSIGGATRVVADHVAALRRDYGQQFDVTVLCGNAEDAPPYRITGYVRGGVRVHSISTSCDAGIDWIEDDPNVTTLFREVLDAVRPDLVHFHCIQRLGAGIVEAAAARGIPYVVTTHDAWWISDHQFLLDGLGRPTLPWEQERFGSAANPRSRSASVARRRRLYSCLAGAAAVTTVSEAFARIYRRAGIAAIRPIPNGLPMLPPIEPQPRAPGRLRLGHFGGSGRAKGLHLLRNALRRHRFEAFELLAVDDAAGFGETRQDRWGTTDITLVGRVPQHCVGALYGRIDVLAAPSVWPESFGLVVAEALAYGKWVVVANRGALAEQVADGQNGLVFDPDDPEALGAALRVLHADPERFATAPAQIGGQRTLAQQTAEFVALYADILAGAAGRSGGGDGAGG